jgi:hypothetical protein
MKRKYQNVYVRVSFVSLTYGHYVSGSQTFLSRSTKLMCRFQCTTISFCV